VAFEREGPTHALVATRTPDGSRSWAASTDGAFLLAAQTEELVGRAGHRLADGSVELD
jgi:hypothetical protein